MHFVFELNFDRERNRMLKYSNVKKVTNKDLIYLQNRIMKLSKIIRYESDTQ